MLKEVGAPRDDAAVMFSVTKSRLAHDVAGEHSEIYRCATDGYWRLYDTGG
jgi:hypothetical protein